MEFFVDFVRTSVYNYEKEVGNKVEIGSYAGHTGQVENRRRKRRQEWH